MLSCCSLQAIFVNQIDRVDLRLVSVANGMANLYEGNTFMI